MILVLTGLIPLTLISYKLFVLDYPVSGLIPAVSYRVDLGIQVDGHGEDIRASTFFPSSDARQIITEEQNTADAFVFAIQPQGLNRIATWQAGNVSGRQVINYSFSVQPQRVQYQIPARLPIPASYPANFDKYLQASPGIQVQDPLIDETLATLFPDEIPGILETLTILHRYLQDSFENRNFSGYTDALTALKLGEASCNGKSRLFAAFARKLNLPSRLVGGLILKQGVKRVTHQWLEVYVNGHWIPFDTINDHFASIPANYLRIYTGDLSMFTHTTDINFQYSYKMTKRLVPRHEAQAAIDTSALNVVNLYALFEQIGISQNLLKIILMLPFGALVMVVLRNVIGLETYGTFLPALIAAAARETGFWWGITGFTVIILLAGLIARALDSLQLLHTPKLAIMFTMVVIIMMGITVLGVNTGLLELAHITLFPIAVLTITAERFAVLQTEQDFNKATIMLATTLVAVAACYAVMDSVFLQSLILIFPEFLLVIIALNLWIGRWIGIRAMEFIRFRRLIQEQSS
jgi:transglutaminase-like putative cysteine protease